jgi:hypothetical protein
VTLSGASRFIVINYSEHGKESEKSGTCRTREEDETFVENLAGKPDNNFGDIRVVGKILLK